MQLEKEKRMTEQLKTYVIDDSVSEIKHVGDIWQGYSIFYYDPKSSVNQVGIDDEGGADRAPDFLKNTWE